MSQIDSEVIIVEWLNKLTDPQIRALAHQIGFSGATTYPVDKLRKELRKEDLPEVMKIYEEHYGF